MSSEIKPFGTEGEVAKLEESVIGLNEDSQLETVIMHIDRVEYLYAKLKEIRSTLFNDVLVEWINRNGEFEVGDMRYRIVNKKTTKLVDVPGLVDKFLSDHSIEELVDCLSSNAFKVGECRKHLTDEQHAQHFVTEVNTSAEGKKMKTVEAANKKFIK